MVRILDVNAGRAENATNKGEIWLGPSQPSRRASQTVPGDLAARAPQTSVSGQPRGSTLIFVNIGRLPLLSGLIDASRNSLSIKSLGRCSHQTLTEIAARIGLHKTRKAVRVAVVEPTSQAGGKRVSSGRKTLEMRAISQSQS